MTAVNEKLVKGAGGGCLTSVQEALVQGADVNCVNSFGHTALLLAGVQGHVALVRHLVNNGANINATCEGKTALAIITQWGRINVVKYLISAANADVNKFENLGWTPLSMAASQGYLEIVKLLICNGANVNEIDGSGKTPLELALSNKQAHVVEYLRNIGAEAEETEISNKIIIREQDCSTRSDSPRNKFLPSQQNMQIEIIETNVNKADKYGNTLLSNAVQVGDLEQAKWLLDNGAQFSIYTAFLAAVDTKNLEMVRLLESKGAPVNIRYKNGSTPLMKSIENNNFEIVEELVKNNADVNMFDGNGTSPLVKAIETKHFPIIQFLILHGAEVNQSDGNGNLPLITAVGTEDLKIVRELVLNAARPSNQDGRGNLPLWKALDHKNKEIVEYLIENGGDSPPVPYMEENNVGKDKSSARKKEYLNMIELCGYSALTKSIQMENFELVKYFVKQGADVNFMDSNQHTPLSMAASMRNPLIFDYLVKAGGDVTLAEKEIEKFAEADENFSIFFNLMQKQVTNNKEPFVGSNQEEAPQYNSIMTRFSFTEFSAVLLIYSLTLFLFLTMLEYVVFGKY